MSSSSGQQSLCSASCGDLIVPRFRLQRSGYRDFAVSYNIKGKIYRTCVQSVLTFGTETRAMKKANLRSLERMETMMVRWMSGMSPRDRKFSVYLYSLLRVQSMAD